MDACTKKMALTAGAKVNPLSAISNKKRRETVARLTDERISSHSNDRADGWSTSSVQLSQPQISASVKKPIAENQSRHKEIFFISLNNRFNLLSPNVTCGNLLLKSIQNSGLGQAQVSFNSRPRLLDDQEYGNPSHCGLGLVSEMPISPGPKEFSVKSWENICLGPPHLGFVSEGSS